MFKESSKMKERNKSTSTLLYKHEIMLSDISPTLYDRILPEIPPELSNFGKCMAYLKENGYWTKIVHTFTFFLHFMFVMLGLFFGAMVLAYIEDPVTPPHEIMDSNLTDRYVNLTYELEYEYNISISPQRIESLIQKLDEFIEQEESLQVHEHRKDQKFIFLKWLYFVIITSTTIGYGDVSPKTDNGKLFTTCFLVVGIVLMMSLLTRCGIIISAANKTVYRFIIRYVCRNNGLISEELLSVLSIHIIFFLFLSGGVWYGMLRKNNDMTLIDLIYFWFVTLTTCGFGDILYPLEVEVEYIFPHTVYRLFGLAIVLAVIDALWLYINMRRKKIGEKQNELKVKLKSAQHRMKHMTAEMTPMVSTKVFSRENNPIMF